MTTTSEHIIESLREACSFLLSTIIVYQIKAVDTRVVSIAYRKGIVDLQDIESAANYQARMLIRS